jgi:cytochrome c
MRRGAVLALVIAAVSVAAAEDAQVDGPGRGQGARQPGGGDAGPRSSRGGALYQKHCASCHGDKGKGDGPAESYEIEPRHGPHRPGVAGAP